MKKNIKLSDKVQENFIKWGQSVEEFMMKHFEHPLTKKILNDYITLVLSVSIINPSFNSQTKEELMTPVSKFGFECNISDSFWTDLKNSNLVNQLKQVVSLSNQKILSKLEGISPPYTAEKIEKGNYCYIIKHDEEKTGVKKTKATTIEKGKEGILFIR